MTDLHACLMRGQLDAALTRLYGSPVRARCAALLEEFKTVFGCKPNVLFSAPGRTELGGNHTDHQRGCVLPQRWIWIFWPQRLRTPADKSVSSPKAIPSSLWT